MAFGFETPVIGDVLEVRAEFDGGSYGSSTVGLTFVGRDFLGKEETAEMVICFRKGSAPTEFAKRLVDAINKLTELPDEEPEDHPAQPFVNAIMTGAAND